MSENISVFTKVATELGQELAAMRAKAAESKAVPFGMQRSSPDAEARRFIALSPEAKAQYLSDNGVTKTLNLLKRGQSNA